jgi:hypothetical protein
LGRGCGRIYSTQRFMEFQAYNVLVIASDIRQLEHSSHGTQILFMKARVTRQLSRIQNMQNIYGEIGCKSHFI